MKTITSLRTPFFGEVLATTFVVGILGLVCVQPALEALTTTHAAILLAASVVMSVAGVFIRHEGHNKLGIGLMASGLIRVTQWLSFSDEVLFIWIGGLGRGMFYVSAIWAILNCPDDLPLRKIEKAVLAYSLVVPVAEVLLNLTSMPEWRSLHPTGHWPTLYVDHNFYAAETRIIYFLDLALAGAFVAAMWKRFKYMRGIDPLIAAPVAIGYTIVGVASAVSQTALLETEANTPTYFVMLSCLELFIPLGVAAAMMRRHVQRAAMSDQLHSEFARSVLTLSSVQTSLRAALRDESLKVFCWDTDSANYVDADSFPYTQSSNLERSTRIVRDRNDGSLAIVEFDRALERHKRSVESALAASAIALENARMQTSLQLQVEQIRASGLRVAQATLEERSRIARDLHDSVQQRIIALVTRLRLPVKQAMLHQTSLKDDLPGELESIARLLRDLTHGMYPAELRQFGLEAAVQVAAEHVVVDVQVDVTTERFDQVVESTAYFIICEAMNNAVKHAGPTQIVIAARTDDDCLVFSVVDNGTGCPTLDSPTNLRTIRDRVHTLNGEMVISSDSERGTSVEVRLPYGRRESIPRG